MAKGAAAMGSGQGSFVPKRTPQKVAGIEPQTLASAESVQYNFAKAPEMHMRDAGRKVPIQLLNHVIKSPKAVAPDAVNGCPALSNTLT